VRFLDRLDRAWSTHDSLLCVGLDPDPARFPAVLDGRPDALAAFGCAIVDATADLVCAYKPQIAYYAAVGAEDQLAATIAHVRRVAPHALVILDAKRGDIGPTAALYAREAFERYGADAVTVNPYLGSDGIEPFLAWAERGTVVLCRTSNPGGAEFQDRPEEDPLYLRVARQAAGCWNGAGNVMLVAGGTRPAELARIRALAPEIPLLVPGIGAQGGDVDAVVRAGLDARGRGLVVNSSRAVLYAGSGPDFAEAARTEAAALRDALRRAVAAASP
jgi:orotidine-5'-phosphate decarboxylase